MAPRELQHKRDRDEAREPFDAVVVGAGFGGLGAALTLAERGARVCVLETLTYAGGCASTFRRGGYRFEAGATLFSGFDDGQLFARWIRDHRLDVVTETLDPTVELRAPGVAFDVPSDRDAFVTKLATLPGAPEAGIRAFFAEQATVADVLWEVLDDPSLLPPFTPAMLARHALRANRYVPLARLVGRPALDVLKAHGVDSFPPLRTLLDAVAQITIQCPLAEAEAPFALATMDYYFRGTRHVRGGIGILANALVTAIRNLGGEVRFATAVRRIERSAGVYRVETRRGVVTSTHVVANVLPAALSHLLAPHDAAAAHDALAPIARDVDRGWGACMLYLVVAPPNGEGRAPRHLEIVQDPSRPFVEGNHLFCSISGEDDVGRAPPGLRTMTVSTHVSLAKLRALAAGDAVNPSERNTATADFIAGVQATMRRGLEAFAEPWLYGKTFEMTASPRTFARFTGRPHGAVGGIPRRVGLHAYARLGPVEPRPGLFLVGDSVFPGQSTLATALGGVKVGEQIARRLGGRASRR